MNPLRTWSLFERLGIELEYMIVDSESLHVRPIADRVLFEVAGECLSEIEIGPIAWSNELALHVIELKTSEPAKSFANLASLFQEHVHRINRRLESKKARLMPTAMHPWMNPGSELHLWPHEYNPVYAAFDRIFGCRGHGWANLQSVHLNLPFANDEEFGRLHAAIRLLLPILPALAASSPIVDRRIGPLLDTRLEAYRKNSIRIPSVAGHVIPEAVFTCDDYRKQILEPMYTAIRPFDPEGILQHEWLNARGAIARFDRHAIEIRVLDTQECPAADLAICQVITLVLRELTDERWTSTVEQQQVAVEPLEQIFLDTIRHADKSVIRDRAYLRQFGVSESSLSAAELWKHLIDYVSHGLIDDPADEPGSRHVSPTCALRTILDEGPLARRILSQVDGDPDRIDAVYRQLCDCLESGQMFEQHAT
jgi:gamma-glutamyl:cysteine ligase YbdK (ATP-grasp superfamily)